MRIPAGVASDKIKELEEDIIKLLSSTDTILNRTNNVVWQGLKKKYDPKNLGDHDD